MQVILFSSHWYPSVWFADGRIQFMNAKLHIPSRFPPSSFAVDSFFGMSSVSAYADTAFDRNGDWTILLSDQKKRDHVKRSLYGFSGYRTCFSCVSSRWQIHGNVGIEDEKTEESTFCFLPYLFPLSCPRRFRSESDGAGPDILHFLIFRILIQGESGTQRGHSHIRSTSFAPPPLSVFRSSFSGNDLTVASCSGFLPKPIWHLSPFPRWTVFRFPFPGSADQCSYQCSW